MTTLAFNQFQYRFVGALGRGGFGTVHEVEVILSNCFYPVGTRLARKQLNEEFRDHPAATERFEREIDMIRHLSHPGIVPCRGENLPGSERCYFMPLYPRNLRQLCDENGAQGWMASARFVATIADTMAYAHAQGYRHRDLKPENILLDDNTHPIIADWGLGYFLHRGSKVLRLTKAGIGTEYYCSFRQWDTGRGEECDDIYSLGMLLDELVCGGPRNLTYVGEGVIGDCIEHPSTHQETQFNDVVRHMTRSNRELRLQSMQDVASRMRAVL